MITDAGYTESGADWENDFHAYAFSMECLGPGTYGHPACTAHYNKETGTVDFDNPGSK